MRYQTLILETCPSKLVHGHRLDLLFDPYFSGPTALCCDLCVLKKFADTPNSLTSDESYVLVLCNQIMMHKGLALWGLALALGCLLAAYACHLLGLHHSQIARPSFAVWVLTQLQLMFQL